MLIDHPCFALFERKANIYRHHRRMTLLPVDCSVQILPNDIGSACGIMLKRQHTRWFFLPGVPSEMKHMMQTVVAAHLPPSHLTLIQYGTIGLPEAELLSLIPEQWRNSSNICAKRTGTTISFRLNSASVGNFPDQELLSELGDSCYSFTTEHHALHADIAWVLLQELTQAGHSIAFAESCTAGRISSWLASHSGASSVLRQGAVVYSNDAKTHYCNVPPEVIVQHGAVSEPVADSSRWASKPQRKANGALASLEIAGPGGGSKRNQLVLCTSQLVDPMGWCFISNFNSLAIGFRWLTLRLRELL